MAIMEINEFAASLARYDRLLGIDLGTKTIGLALSDVTRMVATPVETLAKGKFSKDAEKIIQLIEREEIGGIVFGLPLEMDGTLGKRSQSTKAFAYNLNQLIEIPMFMWDERLSTSAIERVLIGDVDMTRKRRKEVVDKAAAAYILQGALDAMDYLTD